MLCELPPDHLLHHALCLVQGEPFGGAVDVLPTLQGSRYEWEGCGGSALLAVDRTDTGELLAAAPLTSSWPLLCHLPPVGLPLSGGIQLPLKERRRSKVFKRHAGVSEAFVCVRLKDLCGVVKVLHCFSLMKHISSFVFARQLQIPPVCTEGHGLMKLKEPQPRPAFPPKLSDGLQELP